MYSLYSEAGVVFLKKKSFKIVLFLQCIKLPDTTKTNLSSILCLPFKYISFLFISKIYFHKQRIQVLKLG